MNKIIYIALVVLFLYGCTTTSETQKVYPNSEKLFHQVEKYKSVEDYNNACLMLNQIKNRHKNLLDRKESKAQHDLAQKDYKRFGCDLRNLIKIPGKWEDRVVKLQSKEIKNNRFFVFSNQVFTNDTQEYIDKNHSVFIHVFTPPLDLFNDEQLKPKIFFTHHNYITNRNSQYKSYQVLEDSELKMALDENKKPMERKGLYRKNSYYGVGIKGKDVFYMKFLSLKCEKGHINCLVKYKVYNYRAKTFKELRNAYKKNIGNYKFKGFSK